MRVVPQDRRLRILALVVALCAVAALVAASASLALKPQQPYSTSVTVVDYMNIISYNNYFVFSTTTLVDGVVTWGAFGKVYTTNRISKPF